MVVTIMLDGENIRSKNVRDLSDEEILKLVSEEIEKRGEVPVTSELDNGEWPVSRYTFAERFGSMSNALWHMGYRPKKENLVENGDTELVEHELRGLEHELGRAPANEECRELYYRFNPELKESSGIPYQPLKYYGGITEPPKENSLVEKLLVEEEDPVEILEQDEEVTESTIGFILDNYLPWVDETSDQDSAERYKVEDDLTKEISDIYAEVSPGSQDLFSYLGRGKTPKEVSEEEDVAYETVLSRLQELKEYGLAETSTVLEDGKAVRKSVLTEEGEEYFESL